MLSSSSYHCGCFCYCCYYYCAVGDERICVVLMMKKVFRFVVLVWSRQNERIVGQSKKMCCYLGDYDRYYFYYSYS